MHKSNLRGPNFKNLKGGAPVDPDSKAMPSAPVVPSPSALEVLLHTLILIHVKTLSQGCCLRKIIGSPLGFQR